METKSNSSQETAKNTFEISFLEDILRRDENDPRAVEVLATLYTEAGFYDKGLALDRKHIRLEPLNPSAYYNCACSLSLTGAVDEAFEKLETSLRLGFDGTEWMMEDPDLETVRKDARWKKMLAEHGLGNED